MPQWSEAIINRHIAPEIYGFTSAHIPAPEVTGEKVEHWLANHFLNTIFRAEYKGHQRQLAFNIIYRAQAAFEAFELGSALTAEFLSLTKEGNPPSGRYYRALRAWEACFLHLQQFVDLITKLAGNDVFARNDGSPEQRAYGIANTIKHWAGDIAQGRHDDGDTVPMWLNNAGFATRHTHLTYVELANLMAECAIVANDLADPYRRAGEGPANA